MQIDSPGLAVLMAATLWPASVDAQDVTVTLRPLDPVTEGSTLEIVADVRSPADDPRPILLTPSAEGTVEIVRGRLMRSDGESVGEGILRFRIPARAHAPGTAIVRVTVATFRCQRRCHRVLAEASVVVRVVAAE